MAELCHTWVLSSKVSLDSMCGDVTEVRVSYGSSVSSQVFQGVQRESDYVTVTQSFWVK